MKNTIKLSALAALMLLFFSACTSRHPHDYDYEVFEQYDPAVKDSSLASSIYLSYPRFATRGGSASAYRKVNKLVKMQALNFFDDEKALAKDFIDRQKEVERSFGKNAAPWVYNASIKVLVNGLSHVTTIQSSYNYEGGAHGVSGVALTNYSLKKGKVILLEDVISDTTALKQYITDAFVEQYGLRRDESFEQQGYFIEGDKLPLSYEFAIMPEGLVFMYNRYDIAPYSFGPISVLVPYIDLKEILLYQPDWDKAEVFPLYMDNQNAE